MWLEEPDSSECRVSIIMPLFVPRTGAPARKGVHPAFLEGLRPAAGRAVFKSKVGKVRTAVPIPGG